MLLPTSTIVDGGAPLKCAFLPHCRVPNELLRAVVDSFSRSPLEVLGAMLDLLLWCDQSAARTIRIADRFLRKRWGHGSGWGARLLKILSRSARAQKLGSGPRGTFWRIPRP